VAGWTARGRFLCILEGSASIARDCKRDIYSRFLHINLYTYAFHSHINSILVYIIVITLYHLHTFNRLLLHLIIVYLLLVCMLFIALVLHMRSACCSIAWFPSIVPVGFSFGWGPPPYMFLVSDAGTINGYRVATIPLIRSQVVAFAFAFLPIDYPRRNPWYSTL
jgi:hypothetical protein